MKSGGVLAIREFVRGVSEGAALFAVNMLVLTPRGSTYTARDYEGWLRGAGFEDVEVYPSQTHLVVARAPRGS